MHRRRCGRCHSRTFGSPGHDLCISKCSYIACFSGKGIWFVRFKLLCWIFNGIFADIFPERGGTGCLKTRQAKSEQVIKTHDIEWGRRNKGQAVYLPVLSYTGKFDKCQCILIISLAHTAARFTAPRNPARGGS